MSKQKEVHINDTKFNMVDVLENKNEEEQENNKEEEKEIENIEEEKAPEINYKKEENVEEKRKRLLVISRYKNSTRFGEWLKKQGFNFNSKDLEEMSNDELETMINDIRFCIATKNTNGMYGKLSTQGILVIENVLRPIYNVDGLSQMLSNDQTYLDTVEELALEYQNYLYVQPQYRLMYSVLSSAYLVHSQHIMLEKLSQTEEGKQMIQQMANQIQAQQSSENNIKELGAEFSKQFGDLL